jgi:hypothetical protein
MIITIQTIFQVGIKKDIEFYNGNNNNIQDIFMFGMVIVGLHNILVHMLGIVLGVVGIMRITTTHNKITITIIITNIGINKIIF